MLDRVRLNHFNKSAAEGSPDRILEDLKIEPGYVIGDIGSGGGYYVFRFAELAGNEGRVYAVDIDQRNLDYIGKEIRKRDLEKRVFCVLSNEKSSNLPENVFDLLFLRNSFHHLENRVGYFKELGRTLKEGGRVAVIDHRKGRGSGPGMGHGAGEGEIEAVMEQADFTMETSFDYLPGQWFFIYRKAL